MLFSDDDACEVRSHALARSLNGILNQRTSAVQRAELLWYRIARRVACQRCEPGALARGENDCPRQRGAIHRRVSQANSERAGAAPRRAGMSISRRSPMRSMVTSAGGYLHSTLGPG